jgi:transcriptional regulator with XRE-family HTH domain
MIGGTELRKEREEAGVTASAVARGMGVTPQYVSKIERYEFITGDTLALYRAAIEAEVAQKEGRPIVKVVPLACPICGQGTEPNPSHAVDVVRHLNAKHREREVVVKSSLEGDAGRHSIIASSGGRTGWLVNETRETFSVLFMDYPYSVMSIPSATYTFEPKNVVPTPEKPRAEYEIVGWEDDHGTPVARVRRVTG